jgi:hypothetical protein
MQYFLFVLFCAGITEFITISKIGLFIRKHPLILKTDLLKDLLECSMCTGYWVGGGLAFYFQYENVDMILLNSIFGPMLYGFLSLFSSFILCSLSCLIADKVEKHSE